MNNLYSVDLKTAYGIKKLSVIAQDIITIEHPIDVLTSSSFRGSYDPTPGSIFGSLSSIGVNVCDLARSPYIDLRRMSGVWLSKEIYQPNCIFKHIGCIEIDYKINDAGIVDVDEERLIGSIRSYFHMLDIATASGVGIKTIALPLLGTGRQRLSQQLMITPLLNECVAFLKRNESVQNIIFVEKDQRKALAFVSAIKSSYSLFWESEGGSVRKEYQGTPMAFISYTSRNRNIADNLCFKLESMGIKVWYAPRNVEGPYAAAISEAIERATYFIVILSRDSMLSEHMLNEIDLAFKRLPDKIKFKPLRIDTADLAPSFNYYLSRQHWMDAHVPPLEARLDEFVESLVNDCGLTDHSKRMPTSNENNEFDDDNNSSNLTDSVGCDGEWFDSDFACFTTVLDRNSCEEFDADKHCASVWRSNTNTFDADVVCTSTFVKEDTFDSTWICKSNTSNFFDLPNVSASIVDREISNAESLRQTGALSCKGEKFNKTAENFRIPSPNMQTSPAKPIGSPLIRCEKCGRLISADALFCPYCGSGIHKSKEINVSQVQFSAVVPKRFIKGEYSMIDISIYEDDYRKIIDQIIANADTEVKEVIASAQNVEDNTVIRIVLFSPDLDISECDETQIWKGRYLTYSFPIELPKKYAKKQILFIASVYFNGVIATKLKFIAKCTSLREQKIELSREDVLTAFISYASQDRSRVATIIQGMKKARPDMDIFFDVESIRSGENWENTIRREIEKRDVLFLCWSNFARDSKWVETEWRYALSNKGIDSIEPIPLVSPTECPPPKELGSKHFNDKALLYK